MNSDSHIRRPALKLRDIESPILRRKHAARYINVSLATMYRIMRNDPEFPPAIALSPNCRGFELAALDRWLAGRVGK